MWYEGLSWGATNHQKAKGKWHSNLSLALSLCGVVCVCVFSVKEMSLDGGGGGQKDDFLKLFLLEFVNTAKKGRHLIC